MGETGHHFWSGHFFPKPKGDVPSFALVMIINNFFATSFQSVESKTPQTPK
jgi:hypothetical protein